MTTTNTKVREIEEQVERLMDIDTQIWNRHGYQTGRDIEKNKDTYLAEVKKEISEKVYQETIDELEDNNYHSLVEALTTLKLIK